MSKAFGIETSAVLAELNISGWSARRLDKQASSEVVHNKNAGDKGAARVNKNLLAGREELAVVTQAASAARAYFASVTLPWSDSGLRLLPSSKFLEVNQKLSDLQTEYNARVAKFVALYPTLITAQAMALGDLFKREEFPDARDITQKFDFRFNFMPVPTAGDWRVDIGTEAQAYLAEQSEKMVRDRVENAMKDAWMRLHEHLTRMSDRLKVDIVEGEAVPRVFRDSMVTSTFELVDMLKAFNITNDPKLAHAADALDRVMQGKSAEMLREDAYVRDTVQQKVDAILNSISF